MPSAAERDVAAEIAQRVEAAAASGTPLAIRGGGTKDFLGRAVNAERLDVTAHCGVVSHEPTELVVTARAGTPLAELEETLAAEGQMLPFEPPRFGAGATIGGTIACGLSGPRRPWSGAARDLVLGARIVNGRGERLAFGGQVMKNVAGYDVARLMTGAMGTLGVLLDVSIKVLPRPARELTLAFECDAAEAIARVAGWAAGPVPLSGACHLGRTLYVRLSGTESGVGEVAARLGGAALDGAGPWADLREHRLAFFAGDTPLWRVSVPPATGPLALPGEALVDWGGGQRWVRTDADPGSVRAVAEAAGGHATLFRGGDRAGAVFHPLAPAVLALHRRLKAAFDPSRVLNPGRMYAEI